MKIVDCGKLIPRLILLTNNLLVVSVHRLRMTHIVGHRSWLRLATCHRHWWSIWRRTSHHGRTHRWRLHHLILRGTIIRIILISGRWYRMTAHWWRSAHRIWRHIITWLSRSTRLFLWLIV